MSVGGLFAGTHTLLVGVEDDPDGGIRVYLGHRGRGLYAVITDADAIEEVRNAWAGGGHVTIPIPPRECITAEER
jgi:hypothetical protein